MIHSGQRGASCGQGSAVVRYFVEGNQYGPQWGLRRVVLGLRVETVRVEFAMQRKEGWKRRRRGRVIWGFDSGEGRSGVSGGEGSGAVARWWFDHSDPEQLFTMTIGEA
ncbi:unnamed protein product [Sphenostylis stenocarpa]|uniref:Uncharacterized protein n=1 Tax=Sphenostylis stenocarpa TaxID=92480 RepID=A0AA86SHB5_9FABA|nr:unnamed protein product [Sphenostylis stenocarpa]